MSSGGVVPARLRVGTGPAAAVLHAVRAGGPVTRDQIVTAVDLSAATVNRQVNALLEAKLITERPDLVDTGAIGRPKIPLTLDRDHYCVAGMHVGALRTALVVADLRGRTLYSHAIRTQEFAGIDASDAVRRLCGLLRELADRFSGRRVLWGGAAIGGAVDADTGIVDHPILNWHRQPLGPELTAALGVPVSVSEHVQAMAAADLILSGSMDHGQSGLFFYARETVGMAMTFAGEVHQPMHGAGTIAGLPVAPGILSTEPIAPLQSVIGTEATASVAARLGVQPDASVIADHQARVLGEAVAAMRDVINPDEIIVAGDAFATHPQGLAPVQAAFDAATRIDRPLQINPTCFGIGVPEAAAIAVALSAVYVDPLAVV
ncbi:Sugar kinase of the NBD/HSP70 family, may contain an N-terminal HTH domain [Gordonia malaquae]|uniref:Putative transcriptional regulator n=1 Tax=Gordonia malaquae NBRC 108250 TaxID=1223542 RepID=M3VGN9_GORML|nr:ROK family transcriptional regulator [Gordonia malaquae]GAC81079.1 putative transcriptional regulator [Gordonia malaquae NBRC 108250]SEB76462.1 Sugar kinase of the NBD/HSP70 family, may contain an N-terminal HTH domain [Gordonia malaquae]